MFKLKKLALYENPDLPEPYNSWGWNNLRELVLQSCLKGVTHPSSLRSEGTASLLKNFLPLSRDFEVEEREIVFRLPTAFGDTFIQGLSNTVHMKTGEDLDDKKFLKSLDISWGELHVPSGWVERVMFVLNHGAARVEAVVAESKEDWNKLFGSAFRKRPYLVGREGAIEIKLLEQDEGGKVKKALIWRAFDVEDEPVEGLALPYEL